MMTFNDGVEVYAANGQKLGELGQVIMMPQTSIVSHIIVRKGTLFWTDKVIPVKDIFQALRERVILRASAKIDTYPDYVQANFVPFVEDAGSDVETPPPASWYPPFWKQEE